MRQGKHSAPQRNMQFSQEHEGYTKSTKKVCECANGEALLYHRHNICTHHTQSQYHTTQHKETPHTTGTHHATNTCHTVTFHAKITWHTSKSHATTTCYIQSRVAPQSRSVDQLSATETEKNVSLPLNAKKYVSERRKKVLVPLEHKELCKQETE